MDEYNKTGRLEMNGVANLLAIIELSNKGAYIPAEVKKDLLMELDILMEYMRQAERTRAPWWHEVRAQVLMDTTSVGEGGEA